MRRTPRCHQAATYGDVNNKQTLASSGTTITNGNATLSSTNYNAVKCPTLTGVYSYDVLKTNTSTLLANQIANPPGSAVTVTDTGQSTSGYTPATVDGTGGAAINGGFIYGLLTGSATLTFTSISARTCQEQTIAVTGATAGKPTFVSPGASLGSNINLSWSAWVSAANTVSVRVCNLTGGAITPSAVTWNGWVIQ